MRLPREGSVLCLDLLRGGRVLWQHRRRDLWRRSILGLEYAKLRRERITPCVSSFVSILGSRNVPSLPYVQEGRFMYVRTIERNRQTVSVGCAPTPIQYFARSMSSRMSLCCLPDVSYESFLGTGSYVPITSRGLLFRAVLWPKKED